MSDHLRILPKLSAHNRSSQAPQSWKPRDQETTKALGKTVLKAMVSKSQGQGK